MADLPRWLMPYEEHASRPAVGSIVSVPIDVFSPCADTDKAYSYAMQWKSGSNPPPVQVRHGGLRHGFIPVDGHHRATAARILGLTTILAEIVP